MADPPVEAGEREVHEVMDWAALDLTEAPPFQVAAPLPANSPTYIVDDDTEVLELLTEHLRACGYPVQEFADPHQALAAISEDSPALLISDVVMPELNGIDLACRALEQNPQLAVIILTGAGSEGIAISSLRLGVQDYLQKPVDLEELDRAVQRVLYRRTQSIYRQQLEGWLRSEVARHGAAAKYRPGTSGPVTLQAMAALLDAMAGYAEQKEKSLRIANLALAMARHLGLPEDEIEAIGVAGLLHDIGMVEIEEPEAPSREGSRAPAHPRVGAEILRCLSRLEQSAIYVLHHHERLDGSGYPEGLRSEEIPLGAQIVGLAETFESLLEGRPSWPALAPGEALETLRAVEDIWYGSRALDALEATLQGQDGRDA